MATEVGGGVGGEAGGFADVRSAVLGGWAFASVILCVILWPAIANLRFPDPDDAMRLLQVRDWLGGQSWWDVGQHRLNNGRFPMHWSRLVDLPIAGALLVLDPLLGPDAANRVALTVVPLFTLLVAVALIAELTRRLAGADAARLSVLLAPLSIPIVFQLRPIRIDHHGWQIVLALAATLPLAASPTRRNGLLSGLALGVLLSVSLEGLPMAVALVAVPALAWVADARRRGFLLAQLWAFLGSALVLHAATRGPAMLQTACDAMSPPWLAALAAGASCVAAAPARLLGDARARFAVLLAAGVAAAAAMAAIAPQCLGGPFATLDPMVRTLWYERVLEGRPAWDQSAPAALATLGLTITGLFGCWHGWRRTEGAARERWLVLLALAGAATVVAVFVNRASATANALALPGAAALALSLLERARRVAHPARRTLATAGALAAASPGLVLAPPVFWASEAMAEPAAPPVRGVRRTICRYGEDVGVLAQLPPGRLFAPIDISPDIIARTRHHAIGSGYHRNADAMELVMSAFLAAPDEARAIVERTGSDYVVGCPGMPEVLLYEAYAPDGLWARLERGERVEWLEPVPMRPSPLLVWRVKRR